MPSWLLLLWSCVLAEYGVVLECELESSVVHVLKYDNGNFQVLRSQSVATNLSSLVTLTPLYVTAKLALENEGVDHTEVPLMVALTGFRQLALSSPLFVAAIIESLYEDIAEENFALAEGWVFVPSGEEEAVMRWLGANDIHSASSRVMIDVGETTTSVAINILEGVPLNGLFQVDTGSELRNFFVASYQGFGFGPVVPSIYERYQSALTNSSALSDPCGGAFAGFQPSFNFSACQTLLQSFDILKTSVFCRNPPCAVNGIFSPRFPANSEIVLSGYPFDLAALFEGNTSFPIRRTSDQLLELATSVCNGPFPAADLLFNASGVQSAWPARSSACFGAAWLELLVRVLGVEGSQPLTFSPQRPLAQGVLLQRKVFPGLHNSSEAVYTENCTRMAVVIDAGSSASKVKVFQWNEQQGLAVGDMAIIALDTSLVKVKPGIASPSLTVAQAIESIVSLMKQVDAFVPEYRRGSTPVHLVATGGVRNLLTTDASKAAAIFEGIRLALAQTAYMTHPSFVTWLSGEQEGAFAWLAARSLLHLQTPEAEVATVEVGGATLQIAIEDKQTRVLAGHFIMNGVYDKNVELFSHSWNLYGRDEAFKLHRELLLETSLEQEVGDPCQWTGFRYAGQDNRTLVGKANMTACLEQVRRSILIAQTVLPSAECELPPCFAAVHLPSIPSSSSIQLMGIFRNVAEFFGLSDLVYANKPVVTAQWWQTAKAMCNNMTFADVLQFGPQVNNPALDKPLDTYCHTAAQAYTIIVDLLRMDPSEPQDVSEMSENISWALGYLVFNLQSTAALRPLSCPKMVAAPEDDHFLFWIYVGAGALGCFLVIVFLMVYIKRKLQFRLGREPMLSVQDQLAVN